MNIEELNAVMMDAFLEYGAEIQIMEPERGPVMRQSGPSKFWQLYSKPFPLSGLLSHPMYYYTSTESRMRSLYNHLGIPMTEYEEVTE